MKKILFVSQSNINSKDGGGLGQRAYYSSLVKVYNGRIDILMAKEFIKEGMDNAIGAPKRSLTQVMFSGSIHRFKKPLYEHLRNHALEYDVCVVSGGLYAGDMMDMIHSFGLKVMVIHLNFEREYQMDNKTIRTFGGITPFFVIKNERKAYLQADYNCFMSPADKESFEHYYGKSNVPSEIIGAYEYENYQLSSDLIERVSKEKENCVSISGSMNTVQTIEGVMDFKRRYYNIFKKVSPDWRIIITGRNPAPSICEFAESTEGRIEIVPNPVKIEDVIDRSKIFLCPTNVGGGIKLRVMDGFKRGLPVLAHKVSARGYESLKGEPYFKIYDDEKSFEDGLSSLVDYVNNGYHPEEIINKYLEYFSFEAGTNRFRKLIEEK